MNSITFQLAAILLIAVSVSAQQYRDQSQRGRGAYEGPGGNNFGGMVGVGQRGSFGAGGYEDRDANGERYAARIYTEPEYYGYESNFPGGRANFKAYRSSPEGSLQGVGGQGGDYDSVVVGARGSNRYAPAGGPSRRQF